MPDNQQNSKVATDLRLFVSALRSQQPTAPKVIDAEVWATLPSPCTLLWIENSSVTDGWQLSDEHIITGVPHNKRLFDQRKDFITDNWTFLKNR